MKQQHIYRQLLLVIISYTLVLFFTTTLSGQVIPVELNYDGNGKWELIREGLPYRIKGGGTSNPDRFRELRNRGGNSVRTWGIDSSTPAILDSAYQNGLTVMLGLWIGREKDGFDYNDAGRVAEQLQRFTEDVLLYKDHPAVLAWGIGNEANVSSTNPKVWDAVNDISRMIHEIDGNHPTSTVTASISNSLANVLAERCYDVDFLGVNSYGGIGGVKNTLSSSNWNKPYVMTEWGINGPWETSKSSWGAPIEPTSTQKAFTFKTRYEQFIASNSINLLGSYAFLWNEKFEATLTWFGLFVDTETTPMIDELQEQWTDTLDHNTAPEITGWNFAQQSQKTSYKIFRSKNNELEIEAYDPDGDELRFEYIIRPEEGTTGVVDIPGASYPGIPGIIDHDEDNMAFLSFNGEQNEMNFRLYVFVHDGEGHVSTLTIPVQTALIDLQEEYEFFPTEDAYVRNGIYQDSLLGISDLENLMVDLNPDTGEKAETYLLFDLSQAPPEYAGVSLELYGSGPKEIALELWGFGGQYWKEEKLKWNNRIIPGSGILAHNSPRSDDLSLFTWDLTDFVEKQFSQKNKVLTLVIRTNNLDQSVFSFFSKEREENQPKIVFNTLEEVVETFSLDRLTVFPNPAQDRIKCTFSGNNFPGHLLSVVSSQGQLMTSFELIKNNIEISLDGWNPGLYYLILEDIKTHRLETTSFFKK